MSDSPQPSPFNLPKPPPRKKPVEGASVVEDKAGPSVESGSADGVRNKGVNEVDTSAECPSSTSSSPSDGANPSPVTSSSDLTGSATNSPRVLPPAPPARVRSKSTVTAPQFSPLKTSANDLAASPSGSSDFNPHAVAVPPPRDFGSIRGAKGLNAALAASPQSPSSPQALSPAGTSSYNSAVASINSSLPLVSPRRPPSVIGGVNKETLEAMMSSRANGEADGSPAGGRAKDGSLKKTGMTPSERAALSKKNKDKGSSDDLQSSGGSEGGESRKGSKSTRLSFFTIKKAPKQSRDTTPSSSSGVLFSSGDAARPISLSANSPAVALRQTAELAALKSTQIHDRIEAEEARQQVQKLETQKNQLADLLRQLHADFQTALTRLEAKDGPSDVLSQAKNDLTKWDGLVKSTALATKIKLDVPLSSSSSSSSQKSGASDSNKESVSTTEVVLRKAPSLNNQKSLSDLKAMTASRQIVRSVMQDILSSAPPPSYEAKPEEKKEVVQLTPEERRARDRTNSVKEVLETEAQFQFDLQVIVYSLYYESLEKVLSKEEMTMLFCNINDISTFSRKLRRELERLISLPLEEQNFGDVFLSLMPEFSVYTQYCVNYPAANELLVRLRKKSSVNRLIEEMQQQPQCQGLVFEDFLIKPVQRICKYPLLLKVISNSTDGAHPDKPNLEKAYQSMCALLDTINTNKADSENAAKLREIQDLFSSGNPNDDDFSFLSDPGRVFLNQGLFKNIIYQTSDSEKIKAKLLFVFNDSLLIAAKSGRRYVVVATVFPIEAVVVSSNPSVDGKVSFRVWNVTDTSYTLTFTCESEEFKTTWMQIINNAKEKQSL